MSDKKKDIEPFPEVPIWNLMGIELLEMKDGYAKLSMPFDKKITSPYGIVQGGALFTLADSAVAVAVYSVAEKGNLVLTIEMKINYLAPVTGGIVEAEARLLREGRIVPAEVDIYNENKLVAKAMATYIIVDEKKLR